MVELTIAIKEGNVDEVQRLMKQHDLKLEGNRIVPKDEATRRHLRQQAEFWDQRQLAR